MVFLKLYIPILGSCKIKISDHFLTVKISTITYMQWLHHGCTICNPFSKIHYINQIQSPLQENHKTTLPNHSIMLWFQLFMESGEKHIHHLSFTYKKIGKSAKKDIYERTKEVQPG